MSVLILDAWTGVVPVLLPVGQPTISSIGVASVGIALPFFFFILAMFATIVPIWIKNHDSDTSKEPYGRATQYTLSVVPEIPGSYVAGF